jgi:tol-pal system protein YbgF
VGLVLAGCAGFPPPLPNRSIPERVDALEKRLSEAGKTLDAQAERIAELEEGQGGKSRGSAEAKGLRDRMEALQERVKRLEGSTEVNGHELDRLSQQLEDTYNQLEQRLAQLERRLNQLEKRPAGPGGEPEEPMSAPKPQGGGDSEQPDDQSEATPEHVKRYQEAFDQLMDGQYEPAIQSFRQFLGDFPDSEYADNARYWLGEAYYVQQEYEKALEAFKRVQRDYPGSDKVPAALLKEGYTYYELQDYRMARKTLLSVTERFPDHRVAKLARQRMDRIRKERI